MVQNTGVLESSLVVGWLSIGVGIRPGGVGICRTSSKIVAASHQEATVTSHLSFQGKTRAANHSLRVWSVIELGKAPA